MSTAKQKQTDISKVPPPQATAASSNTEIAERDIAQRAYDIYLARGAEEGHALDDWLQAERELRNQKLAATT
jgi:hypothetical protein